MYDMSLIPTQIQWLSMALLFVQPGYEHLVVLGPLFVDLIGGCAGQCNGHVEIGCFLSHLTPTPEQVGQQWNAGSWI